MHRHSGNRIWRITVPPHLRRRRRGYQNACYHATKENGFSPVHSVTGFKKLNPPGFEKCRRSRIGGNVVITFGPVSSPPSDARRVVVTLPARKKRDWRLFCCCRAAMESNRNRERRSHHKSLFFGQTYRGRINRASVAAIPTDRAFALTFLFMRKSHRAAALRAFEKTDGKANAGDPR